MTHVIGQRELVKIGETSPGDLVVFSLNNNKAVGIVLELDDDQSALIGVLTSSTGAPCIDKQYEDTLCTTYKQDWVIEPIEDEASYPARVEIEGRAGLLALTTRGWIMNFVDGHISQNGHFNSTWREIDSCNEFQARISRAAIYQNWRIWVPRPNVDYKQSSPIVDFRAKKVLDYFSV